MAKITFDVQSSNYDEIEIGDRVYNVYYDDASIEKYHEQAKKYAEKSKEFAAKDIENLSDEEVEQMKQESNDIAKDFIETFFGKGSFDEVFEACGRSSFNLVRVCDQLIEWMGSKTELANSEVAAKYKTKRKK
ncbi:hypothetical protein Pryu01_02997 [Paraliobacillus ryukyuensis]|uniref:Uncharacterized protein n=1 Tax=Paraliobacillus ryukyuensis TaxID=200904 RepID=A0A366DPP1_9BACI|nr:hypothetical protein [Paraliobacillus ryukyuensis]RBO92071.1 hypothetical protein DES48_11735 [Paraliobacillus ryukyuensis]